MSLRPFFSASSKAWEDRSWVFSLEGIGYLWCSNGNANRGSIGCPFGHDHDIGFDSPVFNSKCLFSGSSPACLNFIANKYAPIAPDDGDDFFKVLFGRGNKSSYALDRFSDEGRDMAGGCGLNQFFDIRRCHLCLFGAR